MLIKTPNLTIICLFCFLILTAVPLAQSKEEKPLVTDGKDFNISKNYAIDIARRVDKLVRDHFYDQQIVKSDWKRAFSVVEKDVSKCANLRDLGLALNKALGKLNSSHCHFVSINDESYHFLHSLFSRFVKISNQNKTASSKQLFTGMHTGAERRDDGVVRYVLNDSPAATAGIIRGDKLITVNGRPYYGYCNFNSAPSSSYQIKLLRKQFRNGKSIDKHYTVHIKPIVQDVYAGYVEATEKSVRLINNSGKKIGYIHVWTGGSDCHEALFDALSGKLANVDGLIFDLRDGYGGNSLDDLDMFYRTKENYPDMYSTDSKGSTTKFSYCFDKPIVAIINGGARSGKELLAYSLKRSKRATLIGQRTNGAVLAGRLFKLDDRCSLYLAVNDIRIEDQRLESRGVEPDVKVGLSQKELLDGRDTQLEAAQRELVKLLKEN